MSLHGTVNPSAAFVERAKAIQMKISPLPSCAVCRTSPGVQWYAIVALLTGEKFNGLHLVCSVNSIKFSGQCAVAADKVILSAVTF